MAKGKIIDATLRFNDKFTGEMGKAAKKIDENTARLNKTASKLNKIGRTMTRTGKSLSAGVTAPIIGLGVTAVKTAADFESGMSKVQAISGATADEVSILTEKAKEMGAKTKFSASESADAFSYMAMAGWKTEDMLSGIEGIMYLAGATGEDLAATSDIVTDALTAFGLKASDTDHFVNVLAKAANNANTNVSMMGETFKYVAPVAGSLGYSVDDMAVGIGLMANSGIKASKAGTALRSMLTNLAKPSKSVQSAMDDLGVSLTNADGTMKPFAELMTDLRGKFSGLTEAQKAQYASSLAGKTGMSGLLAIVNSSQSDFDKLTASIADSSGAAKEMYDVANDNLNGQLTVLKSTVESIAISFGDKLSPYVKQATSFLQTLADKVNNLNQEQIDTIVKIAGVAAAIGPVLLIIGKMFTVGGKLVKGITKAKSIFSKVSGAMGMLSPTGLIVIAVMAALAAVAIVVYKNWDKIKPVIDKVIKAFKSLGSGVASVFNKIVAWFRALPENFRSMALKISQKINSLGGVLGAWRDNIKGVFGGIKQYLTGLIQFITGIFTGNWRKAWEGVKNIFGGIFKTLVNYIKIPLNGVIGIVNKVIEKVNAVSIKVPEWVPGIGGNTYGVKIPKIPMLYRGTDFFRGGVASVNEKGGEIIEMPRGTKVIPHDKSVRRAYEYGKNAGSRIINIPKIPMFYRGTDFFRGGVASVNEKGGEIINMPRGTKVIPHDKSVQRAYAYGKNAGSRIINIPKIADTIIVREEADIDRIADRLAERLSEVDNNIA